MGKPAPRPVWPQALSLPGTYTAAQQLELSLHLEQARQAAAGVRPRRPRATRPPISRLAQPRQPPTALVLLGRLTLTGRMRLRRDHSPRLSRSTSFSIAD
jgi:hypothetical protein